MLINKDVIKQKIRALLSLNSHPAHISAGFAVGVFISFTPPVPGLHTALALAVAFLFRLNKLTCITGTWVNSPITVVPSMYFSYKLGAWLLNYHGADIDFSNLEWAYMQQVLVQHSKPLLLGCAIIGFVAAVISYFACYGTVLYFRRKNAVTAELAEEMKEVGEELK